MDRSTESKTMVVRFSTTVCCPLDHLWRIFEDVDKLPLWVRGLERFEITSPPPYGAGATYDMMIKEGRRMQTYHGKNLIWDPRVRVKEEMWGGSLKTGELITMEYRFADSDSTCTLHYENSFRARLGRRILFSLFGRMYCKAMIHSLKKAAEV